MKYIHKLVDEQLEGDFERVIELFESDRIFNELKGKAANSDWYRFEPASFDGAYFIKTHNGYLCYMQDRGFKFNQVNFADVEEAAHYFFKQSE